MLFRSDLTAKLMGTRCDDAGITPAPPLLDLTNGWDKAQQRSEERRVGKSVDLGGRRLIKKKKNKQKKKKNIKKKTESPDAELGTHYQ